MSADVEEADKTAAEIVAEIAAESADQDAGPAETAEAQEAESTDDAASEQQEVVVESTDDASREETAEEDSEAEADKTAAKTGDWITDDVRALADSYGIEDAELAGFESGGDFHRACRLVDRALTRGDQLAQQEEEVSVDDKKATDDEKTLGGEKAPEEEDLTLDLAQYNEFDEETQRIVKAASRLQEENKAFRAELAGMSKQVQEQFDRLDKERQEAFHETQLSHFHDLIDGMDEGLFGGKKELTDEADGRRKEVWDAYQMILRAQPQIESKGARPSKPPSMEVLVRRASMLAFGDEMLEAERKKIYRSIHEQSRGARPSPGRNKVLAAAPSREKPKTIHDAAREIANSPEIASLFDRHAEQSGNAPQ